MQTNNPTDGFATPSNGPSTGGAAPRLPKGLPSFHFSIFPFFFGAIFFLSGFLAFLAPFPVLMAWYRMGRVWGWLALLTNAVLVAWIGHWGALGIFLIGVAPIALVLPELLKPGRSVESAALLVLGVIFICLALGTWGYGLKFHVNPIVHFKDRFNEILDALIATVTPDTRKVWLNGLEVADWKKELIAEIPSVAMIAALLMVWGNLILLLRANPNELRTRLGLKASFFRDWKVPEFLVWPTIACGAAILFGEGRIVGMGMNLFKFFMALYALQGLCVMSFALDVWRVKRWIRALIYIFTVSVMLPLILSVGFFDLWFDFRTKFRQKQ
mgnify:CR=1 FL=1